ncbi:SDR family NAD(P)-dependent oxidoreductase [Pedosphaera parvula]|uniref:Short-chain dehydrogenase/reductase SDR n=1 Tax=Pedosphaera parvula (strain Ellin514) TaxID=320771 RepID=B9XDZ9_PEDPL|nr:SDR family oxidoreductase [Pedosphaera parvula]EEF61890.1 short-chain dehydrogenase/reductase SDR [Pedosphaera parvula Ellin514]
MSIGISENRFKGLLTGKRILVTGGSGGIGKGICEVLAREGAQVAFTWNGNSTNAAATESLILQQGNECLSLQEDLREGAAAERVVKAVEDKWGGIDGLVNNAAVSEAIPFVLIEDTDIADLMELNFFATFRLCKAALRRMIRQKNGRIVNISSIAGTRTIPGPVHYAASKGALEGLTRSLAHEVGPYGVLVNAVAAGIFEGGLRSTIPEHHQKRYVDACSLSRIGQPTECGELVAWLLSDRNTYMNGNVLFLEGGTLA